MQEKFHSFHPVATILSYLTKAPLVLKNYYFTFTTIWFIYEQFSEIYLCAI